MVTFTYNPQPHKGPELLIVSWIFYSIATVFVSSRLTWRFKYKNLGLDDAMVLAAFLVLFVQTIFGTVAVHYGFGTHQDALSVSQVQHAQLFFWAYQICYKILGAFNKLAFLFLYLRISERASKSFRRMVWTTIIIVTTGSIAFTIGTIFQCMPIHKAWNHRTPGFCTNNTAFWYIHGSFNIVLDIFVYVLPIPLLKGLQMTGGKSKKAGLISVFLLGGFVIMASVARMVELYRSSKSTDPTWGSMPALIWTEVESNTSVICACMPALRNPIVKLWERVRRRWRPQHRQNEYAVKRNIGSRPAGYTSAGSKGHMVISSDASNKRLADSDDSSREGGCTDPGVRGHVGSSSEANNLARVGRSDSSWRADCTSVGPKGRIGSSSDGSNTVRVERSYDVESMYELEGARD